VFDHEAETLDISGVGSTDNLEATGFFVDDSFDSSDGGKGGWF
jgi:hypothetical protein